MVTKYGINVVSYVHTAEGLKRFDELTEEQRYRAATQIKLDYCNAMFAGKAHFYIEEEQT